MRGDLDRSERHVVEHALDPPESAVGLRAFPRASTNHVREGQPDLSRCQQAIESSDAECGCLPHERIEVAAWLRLLDETA